MAQASASSGLRHAQDAYRKGDPALADAILRELQAVGSDGQAESMRGLLAYERGDIVSAFVLFTRALSLSPAQAEFHLNRGAAQAARGEQKAATTSLRQALALRPESATTFKRLADALSEVGAFDAAAACYLRLLALGRIDGTHLRSLGIAFAECGRLDAAQSFLACAMACEPDDVRNVRALAEALRRQKRPAEAERLLRVAIARAPSNVELHRLLSDVLERSGRIAASVVEQAQALGVDATDGFGHLVRAAHEAQGNLAAALAVVEEALRQAPTAPDLLEQSARLNLALDRRPNAGNRFEALARHHADPHQRALARAMAAHCSGNQDAADAAFAAAGDVIAPRLPENYRLALGESCRFSRHFFEALASEPPYQSAAVSVAAGGPGDLHGRHAFMITLDQGYLERYRAVITANAAQLRQTILHLHIIDPVDIHELAQLGEALNCVVTYEHSGVDAPSISTIAAYCVSIRMIRISEFLDRFGYASLSSFDADTYWSTDVDQLAERLSCDDIALFDNPGALPWVRLNGSFFFLRNTAPARRYFDLIARYVGYFFARGDARWRLDQCAMYCCRFMLEAYAGGPVHYRNAGPVLAGMVRVFKKAEDTKFIQAATAKTAPALAEMHVQLARLRNRARRFEDAVALFHQATELDASRIDAHVGRAEALGRLERFDQAEAALVMAANLAPDDEDIGKQRQTVALQRTKMAAETLPRAATPVAASAPLGCDTITEHLVTRVAAAHRVDVPFVHFGVGELLPAPVYDRFLDAIEAFSAWRWGASGYYPDRAGASLEEIVGGTQLAPLADAFHSPHLLDAIVRTLGADPQRAFYRDQGFKLRISTRITRDRRRYALGPHRDHIIRFGSLLVFLARPGQSEELGTCLYRPKSPVAYLDHGIHRDFAEFDRIKSIPFRPNSALGFANFGPAYHGVEPVNVDGPRDVIQLTIYAEPPGGTTIDPN